MTFLKGTIDGTAVILRSDQYKIEEFGEHIAKAYTYDEFPESDYLTFHSKFLAMMKDYMLIASINVAKSDFTENESTNNVKRNATAQKLNSKRKKLEIQFQSKREELEMLMAKFNAVNMTFSLFVKEQGQLLGSAVPRIEENPEKYIQRLKDIHEGIMLDLPYKTINNETNGQNYRDLVNPYALINTLIHLYPYYTLELDHSFADFTMQDLPINTPT